MCQACEYMWVCHSRQCTEQQAVLFRGQTWATCVVVTAPGVCVCVQMTGLGKVLRSLDSRQGLGLGGRGRVKLYLPQ